MSKEDLAATLKDPDRTSESLPSLTIDDARKERKAVRKLDYTVVPLVTIFYLLSYLDRANIGNARVAGLQKDIGLTDHKYQVCVSVLFVPYILAELPANLVLRKIGPKVLMPSLLTIWGMMVTLQGLVKSFSGLLAVRFFLGLVEGPMLPGIVLYLSGFYTRKELSLRLALFFSSASLASAFSGLLAAGIQQMHGIGNLAGWSWIFVLEGLFTVLVGISGFFLLPSTPMDSKFLTADEKAIIMRRLENDRPSIVPNDHFTFCEVLRSFTSPHVIIIFIMFFFTGTTLYGLALFLPSIVNQLGFSPNKTQLLTVGPFAAGFFVTLPTALLSDRYRTRVIPIVVTGLLAVIGFSLYLGAKSKMVLYGSLFLSVPGVYAPVPIIMAWAANNSEPYYRRATTTALLFIATNSGGILSTWRFPTSEGPRFVKTTIMDICFSIFVVLGAIINALILTAENKRKHQNRDKILAEYANDKEGAARAWAELGDKHPDFEYTL